MIGTGNDHSHEFFKFFSYFQSFEISFRQKYQVNGNGRDLTLSSGASGHNKNEVHLALHFLIFPPIKVTHKPAQASP